ncbi:FkbM family methyltransferase [Fluviicola sp.]|uniref:FkbM family methyltransferase n=1 Tax=Fluviicola sp. TaxID=1917219 RepID=UPI00262D51AF|nr:FkbM family methyltransferase [Fluviicola sp.]
MKQRLLTNRFAEKILLVLIQLANSKPWVYKFVPVNTDYKTGSIRKVKRNDIHYQLDISDYQEWLIYFYCKTDSSDYVLSYLAKSEAILDIGANIGQTAFNILQTQTKKGLNPVVYAFEPYPKTFRKLESNIRLNRTAQIRAFNIGLSNQKGLLHMTQHSPSNSGGFRMTTDTQNAVSVPVISLDEFVSEQNISRIDFIKIDVEGFELTVLSGAKQVIQQFRPVLVFEYSVENILAQNGNIEEALNGILENNYKISTKEGLSDLKTILSLKEQTDLICIPN